MEQKEWRDISITWNISFIVPIGAKEFWTRSFSIKTEVLQNLLLWILSIQGRTLCYAFFSSKVWRTPLTTSALLWISYNFCKFPAICKRQWTKEPGNISQFQAVYMYMHVCVYIHMHTYINASYTFMCTCKHTNRPYPNIFTSKLISHVIYKENIKKWMFFLFTNKTHSQTHMDFFWHSLGISTLLWELASLLLHSGNTLHLTAKGHSVK